MMPHDTFRPPWKLLAQLFGEFGGISKIGVVNVDVLRDDRFDPSADTIGRLSLLYPDWPEQFVDVAGLDLRDREFPDNRVSVAFERRRPLITVLFAPGRPMVSNEGFSALLEGGQSDLYLYGFRFLTRRSFLLHDIDARCARSPFTRSRAASRAMRASFSDTSLREPRPSQRCLPSFHIGNSSSSTSALSTKGRDHRHQGICRAASRVRRRAA